MDRRTVLAGGTALGLTAFFAGPADAGRRIRTQWHVRTSEGFDAICFLGPLSGDDFYSRYYRDELAVFAPKLKPTTRDTIVRLFRAHQKMGGLLGPDLCTLLSGGKDASLGDIIASVEAPDALLKPHYRQSPYWDQGAWDGLLAMRGDLLRIFEDMAAAGFSRFRNRYVAPRAARRLPELRKRLAGIDTIAEQEKLLGRKFPDPSIEIILLYFSKPHGIRIQGQRFLTHIDYPDEIVIRNADHELMHPPFDEDSAQIKRVLAVLARDPLLAKIERLHDRHFGYNTLEGLLNEDTVQALEQIINERVGVSVPPVKRWTRADNGMHVLAAGLYGLLKADGYDRTGGNIQAWLYTAAQNGRLAPASLHAAASRVLGRSADKLWPVPKS
jgi:hypothetical protein